MIIRKKKGNGVVKNILKQEIVHEDFNILLNNNIDVYQDIIMFKSNKHQIYTIKMHKKALSSFDDKIYRFNANEGVPYE